MASTRQGAGTGRDRQEECGPGAFRIWIYGVAPEKHNTNVACRFQGEIVTCISGPGTGGTSQIPRFAAQVVHIDIDVDSLNGSNPWTDQKRPSRNDEEDAAELPTGR